MSDQSSSSSRRSPRVPTLSCLVSLSLVSVSCVEEGVQPLPPPEEKAVGVSLADRGRPNLEHFEVLPSVMGLADDGTLTQERIDLGRRLFYDKRLSRNHDISCNSCHSLNNFGVDGKQFSEGHRKQLGGRNSPSVYNAAGHFAQFWDGRAADVEEQAKGPILNPVEMAMADKEAVVRVLESIPAYVRAFKKAFPKSKTITYNNLGIAIGAFERKLVTPGVWDKYLEGDDTALTAGQKRGLQAFVELGCPACHSGAYLGGNSYQKLGVVEPWPNRKDKGRFALSNKPSDRMVFKVPSLRNVAKTGPYFHDGSVSDLSEAVRLMAKHQVGSVPTDAQVVDTVDFLQALTGTPPLDYIKKPMAFASSKKTPKPQPR